MRVVAGITTDREELYRRVNVESFEPTAVRPYFAGAYLLKPEHIAAYNDGVAWMYRDECARAAIAGTQFDKHAAWRIAATAISMMSGMESFYANGDYRYGDWLFDLGGNQAFFTQGSGKLGNYVADNEPRLGTRGIQVSGFAAAVLPAITAHPEIWEQRCRESYSDDRLVRIVDDAPQLDGHRDQSYASEFGDSQTSISIVSDPRNINLFVESGASKVTVRIASLVGAGTEQPSGVITLEAGKATVRNSSGDELEVATSIRKGDRWAAELRIPYSINSTQAQWVNGTDHGRYSVQVNDSEPQSVYFLSTHERFVSRLESLAFGTIALWHHHWQKHRSIPSGYYRSGRPYRWNYGDAGNYAHLIKCISFWLMHRDGTSEWNIIAQQAPDQPITAKPLPDSVLAVQGLK